MQMPLLWAEIDLAAIAHNVRELRRVTDPRSKLMVAVKANGYGHGAVDVARTALKNGATHLGVARLEEGIRLRKAGIATPILILGYTPAHCTPKLLTHHLMPTIYSLDNARNLSAAATAQDQHLTIHIKVDTGMGRLGIPWDALRCDDTGTAVDDIAAITRLPGLNLQGVYTHFASADHQDKSEAKKQLAHFQQLLAAIKNKGLKIPLRHAANSGAIIDMPEAHLDMVRAGIAVYGLYPSSEVKRHRIDLRPALELKARIIHLKQVPAHTKISYGGTFETAAATAIATIPVGYGDGYSRLLSNNGHMLVHGQRAPIVGRVCMDLTMLDVGKIDAVRAGDEVVLIGNQNDAMISADEVAAATGTINYEVVTSLTARVPRLYRS